MSPYHTPLLLFAPELIILIATTYLNNTNKTNNYIYKEFLENGNVVVARTLNRFSSIDQRHVQPNAKIKGAGGAIGLTEDDEKFLRWMLCEPEEGRIVCLFRADFSTHFFL